MNSVHKLSEVYNFREIHEKLASAGQPNETQFQLIRDAGRNNADLLILPVNDWQSIKDTHFQMHVFRAIENGVPLVRAAASGVSGAVDPWGRVLAVSDFFAPGDRTMTAQVPVGRVPTLYAKIGDLFAWLCVATLLVLCVAARW